MISLKPKKDGRGFEIVNDEDAPIPPSVTTMVNKTGNYGFADAARIQFNDLALKEGEVPTAVMSRKGERPSVLKSRAQEILISVGRGRGRGRVLQVPVMEPPVIQPSETEEIVKEEAVGEDNYAEEIASPLQEKEEYAPVTLPPRNSEKIDKDSYEVAAGLFLQGLQDRHADFSIFEDFDEDFSKPPNGTSFFFKDTPEEAAEDQEVTTIAANDCKKDAASLVGVEELVERAEGSTFEGAEGSINADFELDGLDSASTCAVPCSSTAATLVSATTFRPAGKPKPGKTNGYCLFIKHRARETGNNGSINELMRMFDPDWRMLPEQEKQEWKRRAKAPGLCKPPPSDRFSDRGGFSKPSSRSSSVSSGIPSSVRRGYVKHVASASSVTSETSTTTDTTLSYQADVDEDDWF